MFCCLYNLLSIVQARHFIQLDTVICFSPVHFGFCCLECKFNKSGLSVMLNKITRTVESESLELKLSWINWLNILNGISGNGSSFGEVVTAGKMLKIIDIHSKNCS